MLNPLSSLTIDADADAIINQCELAEMSPNIPDELMAPIHMAALLYQGEICHARHLWRRTLLRSDLLKEWYAVCCAKILHTGVTEALTVCQQEHPPPLNQYAMDLEQLWNSNKKSERTEQVNSETTANIHLELVSFLEANPWDTATH